jgi:hypothetical protein
MITRGQSEPRNREEDNLFDQVVDVARFKNVLVAHFRPARTKDGGWRTPVAADGKGWPDLVLVGPGGILYRELKSSTGALMPNQRVWRDSLVAAGANWAVWRPRDMTSGLVISEITVISKPRGR